MTNKDGSIDRTTETLAKDLTEEGGKLKLRQRENITDVGGAGHFTTDNHDNVIGSDDNKDDNDDDYDDGGAASDYEVAGSGGDVSGGNDGVGDGDVYGIGGHGNGEGYDDDDHVFVGDSGGIGDSCNGDRGGVGGSHVNKGDDKGRNGDHRSENRDGDGTAVKRDSDHELVATEDYSEETVLVSNTFPLSVHLINKERSGTQRQSFALQIFFLEL